MAAKKPVKKTTKKAAVPVAIIMGSQSDWATMQKAAEMLDIFGIAYESKIVSAHRTPDRLYQFARKAEADGFKIIIAGAGGAAHLPGMTAALTSLPVLGVPVLSKSLEGMDALLSIAQMPKGVPVGTLAIGEAGAANAGILAGMILALNDPALSKKITTWRIAQTNAVALEPVDEPTAKKKAKRA